MDENTTELNFKLTLADANTILEALQELPFKKVASIVNKIHQQATPQVSTLPETVEGEIVNDENTTTTS